MSDFMVLGTLLGPWFSFSYLCMPEGDCSSNCADAPLLIFQKSKIWTKLCWSFKSSTLADGVLKLETTHVINSNSCSYDDSSEQICAEHGPQWFCTLFLFKIES